MYVLCLFEMDFLNSLTQVDRRALIDSLMMLMIASVKTLKSNSFVILASHSRIELVAVSVCLLHPVSPVAESVAGCPCSVEAVVILLWLVFCWFFVAHPRKAELDCCCRCCYCF